MPLLGIVILAEIAGIVLIGSVLAGGLIWTGLWLIRNRSLRVQSPKTYYFRLLSGLVPLVTLVVFVVRWFTPFPSPGQVLHGSADSSSYVALSSPAVSPFRAMYGVPRAKYGFTLLPKSADVDIELPTVAEAKADGYDAILHVIPAANDRFSTERTVSFKRVHNQYRWIGEQEIWTGPRQYTLPDGSTAHEAISISYATQPEAGFGSVKTLEIEYAGDDPRLSDGENTGRNNLGLKDIAPVLKQWGAI